MKSKPQGGSQPISMSATQFICNQPLFAVQTHGIMQGRVCVLPADTIILFAHNPPLAKHSVSGVIVNITFISFVYFPPFVFPNDVGSFDISTKVSRH